MASGAPIDRDFFHALRGAQDHAERGFRFEQTVREILPWSLRPPVAVSTKSEQLDAFFEYNGWHFLVECKAKLGKITAGSHDWEDFELKVLRRGGGCIGLFCSLYEIDDAIYDAIENLNRRHHTTILIAGHQWDDVLAEDMLFGDFIRYLVLQARSKHASRVSSIKSIYQELNDTKNLEQNVRSMLRAGSATFLRRHRSPRHDSIYVTRAIDRDIGEMIIPLQPVRLRQLERTALRGNQEFQQARQPPPQIAVVRDLSGAGKTTLSVQFASQTSQPFLSIARAAMEPSIDDILTFLTKIGPRFGINQLYQINLPIVYIIDSLDEGLSSPYKFDEFKSLMKILAELNIEAVNLGYLCYPILMLFTIREEYWREWESQLEGREKRMLIKRFSNFSDDETIKALDLYQSAYHFSFVGAPRKDLLDALSHPFTMQIYAEANEYAGAVDVSQHIGFRVLSLFFERKKQDVLKRPIVGYNGDAMLRICADVAADMVERSAPDISSIRLGEIIRLQEPLLKSQCQDIIGSIRSEQILVGVESDPGLMRFRHSRFLEYLMALYIQRGLREGQSTDFISRVHQQIAGTNFASPYIVIDNLKALTASFPDESSRVQAAFAQSRPFMKGLIQQVRSNIAKGDEILLEQATAIKLAIADRDPDLCWHAYFALAATSSNQPRGVVLESFCLAWDANYDRSDVWKLIQKLRRHNLLFDENVVRRLIKAESPVSWFTYFDEVSLDDPVEFAKCWAEIGGLAVKKEIMAREGDDWAHVLTMLGYLSVGKPYPVGLS